MGSVGRGSPGALGRAARSREGDSPSCLPRLEPRPPPSCSHVVLTWQDKGRGEVPGPAGAPGSWGGSGACPWAGAWPPRVPAGELVGSPALGRQPSLSRPRVSVVTMGGGSGSGRGGGGRDTPQAPGQGGAGCVSSDGCGRGVQAVAGHPPPSPPPQTGRAVGSPCPQRQRREGQGCAQSLGPAPHLGLCLGFCGLQPTWAAWSPAPPLPGATVPSASPGLSSVPQLCGQEGLGGHLA